MTKYLENSLRPQNTKALLHLGNLRNAFTANTSLV